MTPFMRNSFIARLLLLHTLVFTLQAAEPEGKKPAAYDTHDGYFVSNKFEPERAASFVIVQDKESFDKVFGSAFVMKDKHHRLPNDAFDSKIVIAVVKRGNATCEFKVQDVAVKDGAITVTYTVTATPQPSATFACPLILSIARGDYTTVQFIENGKVAETIHLSPATTKRP
ncbi:MAG: hypothetical protein WCN98_04025 [Verrucomicrobiaceae bacterium]